MASGENGDELGDPEFLAYRILERLKKQSDMQITRSKFLKLCCIADRYLAEQAVDIGFPRYWYRYGEIASENDLNPRVHKSSQAVGFPGRQYFPSDEIDSNGWGDQQELYLPADDLEDDDFEVDPERRREILEAVRWVVHRLGRENVRSIRRFQYERYAPVQFIRAYSDLRWQLENTEHTQARLSPDEPQKSSREMIEHLLDEMVMTYPEEKFDRMHSLFLRWDDTMRLLLEDEREYDELEGFLDSFIEALSKVELRFYFQKNIPEKRLNAWRDERDDVLEAYREELREVRDGLLLNREASSDFDAIAEPFNETVMSDIEDSIQDR